MNSISCVNTLAGVFLLIQIYYLHLYVRAYQLRVGRRVSHKYSALIGQSLVTRLNTEL